MVKNNSSALLALKKGLPIRWSTHEAFRALEDAQGIPNFFFIFQRGPSAPFSKRPVCEVPINAVLHSGSRFNPHPQSLSIFHLILGGRNESFLRKPVLTYQGSESPGNWSSFCPTRFSLVRISVRDLWLQAEILAEEIWGWGSKSDPHSCCQLGSAWPSTG